LRDQVKQMESVMLDMQAIIIEYRKSNPGALPAPVVAQSPVIQSTPAAASRKRPRLNSDVQEANSQAKIAVKSEVKDSAPDKTSWGGSSASKLGGENPLFDASVEWGDVFNDSFSMDLSPLPLGSPPIPGSSEFSLDDGSEPMDQALVNEVIEALVTNVTTSALVATDDTMMKTDDGATLALTRLSVSPEASPRSSVSPSNTSPNLGNGRANRAEEHGVISPMNTTTSTSANKNGDEAGTKSKACIAGDSHRRRPTAPERKDAFIDPTMQKIKIEGGSSEQKRFNFEPQSALPTHPLSMQDVASRLAPQVTQRQQIALLSCMLQHFAAAVPKTLMQMQESYGASVTDESAFWSGQHPLQHNPISSEVA